MAHLRRSVSSVTWSLFLTCCAGVAAAQAPLALDTTGAAEALERLDQRVRILERLRELDQEAAAAAAKAAPAIVAGKDGFAIRSADGGARLRIGGYVQVDGRFWLADDVRARANTFVLRRVRPILEGTVSRHFDFRLMPDFGEGKAVLQDAYLEMALRPGWRLQAGRFKPPVGLERLQSGSSLLFVERALPTGLVPNRDLGLLLRGELGGVLTCAFGVFNGVVDGGSGDIDTDDGKELTGRFLASPLDRRDGSPFSGLGLGVAGSWGNQTGSLPSYKTPGQASFFTYADSVRADGRRWRIVPQAYWYVGCFGFLGECAVTSQEVAKGKDSDRLRTSTWQVAASYLVTGEQASYKGASPRRAYDPGKRQWGALEMAARYHHLQVDHRAFPTFAQPRTASRSARAWAVGCTWYLSRNAKLNLDYEQTRFSGGAAAGDRNDERIVLDRLQISF